MNLTWHIVKKDLRALRWPLLVWAGLIAAKLTVGLSILTTSGAGDAQLFGTLDGLSKLLAAFECLGVVLVAALVQEDLLVGTTAFWATRPIGGGRLLAAKLLGLAVIFIVLPVLVTLPWWIGCHLTFGQVAGAAMETAALHLVVVLLGLLLAVVTDGLGRFMLWLLAFVAAIPLIAAIVGSYLSHTNAVVTSEVATTRFIVSAGVLLLGIAVVVTHQFLTRRTWRSVTAIAAMLVLILGIAAWWPWSWHFESGWNNFLARQAEKAWPVGVEPPGLTFAVDGTEIVRRPFPRTAKHGPYAQLVVKYHVDGLPGNQMLWPAVNNYALRWADGTTHKGWSSFNGGPAWFERISLGASATAEPLAAQVSQYLPEEIAARLDREPTTYELRSRFAVVELEAATRVPLAPGSRTVIGTLGERIGSVEKDGEEVLVTFVRHRPVLLGDYLADMGNYVLGGGRGMTIAPSRYRLENREQHFVDQGTSVAALTSRIAGVELMWETKSYRAMKANGAKKPRFEAMKALDEAELIRVTFHSRGTFAHEIKVDPLVLAKPVSN
jgi:hypothetical protein